MKENRCFRAQRVGQRLVIRQPQRTLLRRFPSQLLSRPPRRELGTACAHAGSDTLHAIIHAREHQRHPAAIADAQSADAPFVGPGLLLDKIDCPSRGDDIVIHRPVTQVRHESEFPPPHRRSYAPPLCYLAFRAGHELPVVVHRHARHTGMPSAAAKANAPLA